MAATLTPLETRLANANFKVHSNLHTKKVNMMYIVSHIHNNILAVNNRSYLLSTYFSLTLFLYYVLLILYTINQADKCIIMV